MALASLGVCCKNSGKTARNSESFRCCFGGQLAEAQDFRGGRDVDRCRFLAKTAKNSEGIVRYSRNIVYQAILPTAVEMAKEELTPVDSLQKQVGSGARSVCTIPPCGRSKLFATRSEGSRIEPLMHI
jgi:hypothetical protein